MTTFTTPVLPDRVMRNASPRDLAAVLQAQQRQSVDLVLPAEKVALFGGMLVIEGADLVLLDDGVLDPNGMYRLTANADAQLGDRFGIPTKYIRTLRTSNVPLLDENINNWAAHSSNTERKVLVRLMVGQNPEDPTVTGYCRAVMSNRFFDYDNFDVLLAALNGIREAGLAADDLDIRGDLTDDKMFVTVNAPEIKGYGHKLVEGYRSPYANGRGTGHGGMDAENLPIVSAGLLITNSPTGNGQLKFIPRLTVRVCNNGLQITKDAMCKTHLGGVLEEGSIQWSAQTRKSSIELAKNQARDAVATFLSVDFVQAKIDEIEAESDTEVKDVNRTIEAVAKQMAYSEDEANDILNFFMDGGQRTAGGVLNAVTAAVQQIEDPERAFEIEAGALDAMKVAVTVNA